MTSRPASWRLPEIMPGKPFARLAPPLPPISPEFASGELHLWGFEEAEGSDWSALFLPLLSQTERERIARLRDEEPRRAALLRRGVLRLLLALYSGKAAEGLRLDAAPHGKPFLPDQGHLHFNLSQSGKYLLIGITHHIPVGVDLERIRPLPEINDLVRHFFSPEEQQSFWELPAERATTAFFAGWSRKEAYVKALGDGITLPLEKFSVSWADGRQCRLLQPTASPWSLLDLAPFPECQAAAAIAHPTIRAYGGTMTLTAFFSWFYRGSRSLTFTVGG